MELDKFCGKIMEKDTVGRFAEGRFFRSRLPIASCLLPVVRLPVFSGYVSAHALFAG